MKQKRISMEFFVNSLLLLGAFIYPILLLLIFL